MSDQNRSWHATLRAPDTTIIGYPPGLSQKRVSCPSTCRSRLSTKIKKQNIPRMVKKLAGCFKIKDLRRCRLDERLPSWPVCWRT
jgi:hypothetical protein